jgi:hypothetical protein
MTAEEWAASTDARAMVAVVADRVPKRRVPQAPFGLSERRLRLFLAACCRRRWEEMDPVCRYALEAAEKYADGPCDDVELLTLQAAEEVVRRKEASSRARNLAIAATIACCQDQLLMGWIPFSGVPDRLRGEYCLWKLTCEPTDYVHGEPSQPRSPQRIAAEALHSVLLRCVCGNPFRPRVTYPAWRTPILSLAQAAYDERSLPSGEFDALRVSVLADALEEAGASGEALEHLRGPGPHVRGCWVVDLILGRS